MNKLDHPEINTSGLAAEVRKAMARQAIKSQPRAEHRPTIEEPSLFGKTVDDGKDDFTRDKPLATDPNFASLDLLPSNLPKSPRLSSELIFESNEDNEYQLIDLLKFQDADFLVVAYRAVLKREPDSFGYNHYLEQLREGHLDRLDLLASLRFSPEGELKKVHIKGLALPTFMRRIGHLPIIGYPVRLGLGILRLPSLIHRVRRQEAYSGAQSRKLAEQANAAADYVDTLSAYLLNLSAATTSFFRRAELHDERHRQIQQRLENLIEQQQVDTVVGQQQLKALLEQQQQIVAEVRQEHRTELVAIQEEQARHLRQAQKLIQGQRLVQEQQSLLESSTADMRNRLDTLESSAYARIAQSESSTQALIAQLESSSRTWIAQFESSVRAEIAGIETSFQNEIASVATSTANLQTRITEAQPLAGDLQERIGTLESAANDLRFTTHKIESHANSMQTEIEKLYQQLQHARTELALQGKRLSLIVEEARRRLPAPFDQQQLEIIATEEQHKLDALYAELEDNFRGSHDEIKERFRTYLPHINSLVTINGLPIVDLGCGRGEWLELLQEEGYSAVGVDTNRVLLDRCRARGLDVVETDILDYLRGQPDRSLAAVTGFHIIEHLEIGILMRLLDEIARVLSPGGVVIFETPNPENVLVGSNYFYFDPTHRNPLPSLLMKFLLESRGLHRVEVMNLHAWNQARLEGKNELTERFNDLFYGPMDYAIAGWKVSA